MLLFFHFEQRTGEGHKNKVLKSSCRLISIYTEVRVRERKGGEWFMGLRAPILGLCNFSRFFIVELDFIDLFHFAFTYIFFLYLASWCNICFACIFYSGGMLLIIDEAFNHLFKRVSCSCVTSIYLLVKYTVSFHNNIVLSLIFCFLF